jgi:DNA-binding XRE family transcriptional regulator
VATRRRQPREPWTAERIALLRADLGLTQSDFAGEIGVRQQTVSEWETGRYAPRGASVKLLGMLAERAPEYVAGGPLTKFTDLSHSGTGNRERGMGNGERGTGNGERGTGNGDDSAKR